MSPVLELDNVTKRFGETIAVDRLTLRLDEGAFLGLLGRNGAGKSTTLKLVTGLLKPTHGSVRLFGTELGKNSIALKRSVGVMPEDMALFEFLTGPQYLRFVGRMYGLDEATIEIRQKELFAKLDLAPDPRTLTMDYSFGMKKKLALCAALIHAPRLVLLDEPFEGVDPVTGRTIKDLLRALSKHSVTIVLTTHLLEIVERLCPLVAIMDHGKLRSLGTISELCEANGAGSLEDVFLKLSGGAQEGDLSWL
jgi:ABC-2 type transport system ATP-binding protein